MTERKLSDLVIVGYADKLPQELLPQIVPPVFKERAPEGQVILPPFKISGDTLLGGTAIAEREFDELEDLSQVTKVPGTIEPAVDHVLWISRSGTIEYSGREDVLEELDVYSWQMMDSAYQSLADGDLKTAKDHCASALAANDRNLQAAITSAVVSRIEDDPIGFGVAQDIASSIVPGIDFVGRVEQALHGYAKLSDVGLRPQDSSGPQKEGALVSGGSPSVTERELFALADGNPRIRGQLLLRCVSLPEYWIAAVSKPQEHAEALVDLAKATANGSVEGLFSEVGHSLAELVLKERVEEKEAEEFLLALRAASEMESSNGTSPREYFPFTLKGWAERMSGGSWGHEAYPLVRKLFNIKRNLRALGVTVRDSLASRGGPGPIIKIGWSHWHEDCVLIALGKHVLENVGVTVLPTVDPLFWGTLENDSGEQAEVAFMNEIAARQTYLFDESRVIYSFGGYYGFVARSFLEQLLVRSEELPVNVRQGVHDLLAANDGGLDECLRPEVGAWLLARGRLRFSMDTDFSEVTGVIARAAKSVATVSDPVRLSDNYNHEFWRFCRGDRAVFLGGANHAANLRRWWAKGERPSAFLVLDPGGIAALSERYGNGTGHRPPFRNRIVFGGKLADRQDKRSAACRDSLADFFVELARTVEQVAIEAEEADWEGLLENITAAANERLLESWGFISHPEDLLHMLRKDDVWGVQGES